MELGVHLSLSLTVHYPKVGVGGLRSWSNEGHLTTGGHPICSPLGLGASLIHLFTEVLTMQYSWI